MELSNPTLECKPQTGWQRQSAQPRPTRTETSERSLHHSCSLGSCTQTHRKTRTHILITEPGKLMAKKTEKLLQRSLFWTQNATVVLKYFSTEEQAERYMHSVMDGSALLQTDSDRQLPVSLCILFTGITSTIYTQCSTMRQAQIKLPGILKYKADNTTSSETGWCSGKKSDYSNNNYSCLVMIFSTTKI